MKPLQLAGIILGACALLAIAGFLWFVVVASGAAQAPTGKADAVIVLTGKAPRIADAVTLLAQGKSRRLLISGVNTATTRAALKRRYKAHANLFDCCIDLDQVALNTRGNAHQSAIWMKRHKFKSLILVTSGFHMPRSVLEFTHLMPDIDLTAHPVQRPGAAAGGWWRDSGTFRQLAGEYVKLLIAFGRIYALERTGLLNAGRIGAEPAR